MQSPPVKPPRKKSPGRFHHGDLAEQAAVEAVRLVAERGHAALSMRAIATTLGVTEPALYRHYDNREALLAEVAVRGFEAFGERAMADLAAAQGPLDGVQRFCQSYVHYAAEHRGWFLLTFSREMSESEHASRLWVERLGFVEQARLGLLNQIAPLLPPGENPADLYRLVWSTAHGLAFLVVERVFQLVDTDEERLAAADDAIALLVSSLAARMPDADRPPRRTPIRALLRSPPTPR